jgi:sirohydrochlorin cobaltochelatase
MQAKRQETSVSGQSGLLIIGHGTSSSLGRVEFQETVDRVKALMPNAIVEAGFLEGGAPTIETAWQEIVACGVKKVIVSPLLLFAAGHANNDIPRLLARLAEGSPMVEIRQMPPLGCDPSLVRLSVQRYQSALDAALVPATKSPPRTRLLFVARGAQDPRARDEAIEYGRLVTASAKPDDHSTCFLAMAKPTFDEETAATAASSLERVVVVPHLLFSGKLLERVREKVAEQEESGPRQQWLLADHLGSDPVVARTIARRFNEAFAPRRPHG